MKERRLFVWQRSLRGRSAFLGTASERIGRVILKATRFAGEQKRLLTLYNFMVIYLLTFEITAERVR
jgi:hypothetical protein